MWKRRIDFSRRVTQETWHYPSSIKIQWEACKSQQPTAMIDPMRMQYIIKLYMRFLAGSIISRVPIDSQCLLSRSSLPFFLRGVDGFSSFLRVLHRNFSRRDFSARRDAHFENEKIQKLRENLVLQIRDWNEKRFRRNIAQTIFFNRIIFNSTFSHMCDRFYVKCRFSK